MSQDEGHDHAECQGDRHHEQDASNPSVDEVIDLGCRRREPHRAHHVVPRKDRDRHEDQVEAQCLREASSGGDLAGESSADLGSSRVVGPGGRGFVGDHDRRTQTVDDDDSMTLGRAILVDEALERGVAGGQTLFEKFFGATGDHEGVPFEARSLSVFLDVAQISDERKVLGHEDDPEYENEGGDEPCSHSGTSSRNPTPRTDTIHRLSPNFLRSDATWASTVLVGPYQ